MIVTWIWLVASKVRHANIVLANRASGCPNQQDTQFFVMNTSYVSLKHIIENCHHTNVRLTAMAH